jgi:hypothetical protein
VGIIASNNTFSLSEITSSSTPEGDDANKLTSSKWDSLIARVAEMSGNIQDALRTKNGNDISYNSGTVTVGNNFLAGGSIKVGNTTESCSSATAGSIKYANGCLSYCNGSVWKDFSCETTTGSTPSTPKTWFGTIYRDLLE